MSHPNQAYTNPNDPRNAPNNNNNNNNTSIPANTPTRPPPNAWQQRPPPPPQYARPPPPQYAYNPYAYMQQAPPPPQQQQQQQRPPSMWQPTYPQYYPPPQQTQQSQSQTTPAGVIPPVKPKRALVITDKDGNPIDLTGSSKPSTSTENKQQDGEDAGAKLRQAALERIAATTKTSDETKRKEAEEKAKRDADEKAKRDADEKAKKEAEELAKKEADEKAKREADEQAKRQQQQEEEEAEKAKLQAAKQQQEEPPKRPSFLAKLQAKKEAAGISRGSSLSALQAKLEEKEEEEEGEKPATLRPGGASRMMAPPAAAPAPIQESIPSHNNSKRRVYTKVEMLRFKEMKVCCCRPNDLPEITIERIQVEGGGGGGRRPGGGGGRRDSWQRGAAPPRDSQRRLAPQEQAPKQAQQWARGVAPPPAPPPDKQQRNRGGRNNQGPPLLDGPVAPLVVSENRWRPKKNANALIVAEKQVKAILNKMTKEKFDKLSTQMCEIPILSYDMLTMMIHNVYEKAIDEPTFGDMYADLCAKLSQLSKQDTTFIKIIPSDEEPPTDDGEATGGKSSSYQVYRWSNNVSTTDSEIVGPYESPEECKEVALSGEDLEPTQRDEDMKLELVSLEISNGTFIKIMKKKDEENVFYVVYFPASEHEDCGQQLSKIFLSERECLSDAVKQNSFKRSLLNKCQDEFDKQDIYVGWKEEKRAYEESKDSMTEAERNEKEAELDFRRIAIKKQMLGNVKFIGQLYKKGLLKEKIMRYCIGSLLKLDVLDDEAKYPEYKDSGDYDLDEEDHEAACSMFTTIGKTIDQPHARTFMNVCFTKMERLSNDKSLNSRYRFMYKDLIELRGNRWEPRRETEEAKTIDEIRKDFEREERRQEQQSRQMAGGYRGGNRNDRRDFDRRDNRRDFGGGNRGPRQPKPQADADGFTVVPKGAGKKRTTAAPPIRIATRPKAEAARPTKSPSRSPKPSREPSLEPVKKQGPPPLDNEKLERRIDTIRNEYIQDPSNVEELLLSYDELSGTPDAGLKLVERNGDRIFDCKDAERQAIAEMLALLFEKGRLSKSDVQSGLAELVEFIDSFVIDSPKAYDYLAEVLSDLIAVEALDVTWLCEQAEKLKLSPEAVGHEKVVRKTMEAMKTKHGVDAVQKSFGGTDDALKLAGLIDADTWNDMASDIMS